MPAIAACVSQVGTKMTNEFPIINYPLSIVHYAMLIVAVVSPQSELTNEYVPTGVDPPIL